MKKLLAFCLTLLLAGVAPIGAETPKKEELPKLLKQLKSGPAKEKIAAAQDIAALGQVKAADAVPAVEPLLDAMKDKDTGVRSAAILALGKIGPDPKTAVPPLSEALKDKDAKIRNSAATALGLMGPDAKEALPALKEAKSKEKEKGVNKSIGMAINYINEKTKK